MAPSRQMTGAMRLTRAGGMLPAEGVGAVILKPLTHARQDGDRIIGVIEAWGINHSGRPMASRRQAVAPRPRS